MFWRHQKITCRSYFSGILNPYSRTYGFLMQVLRTSPSAS